MDIQILTDDAQRASFYFDNAGRDPEDVLREVSEGVQHYFDTHGGDDKLPEALCGAVCATLAAVNLYALTTVPMDAFSAMGAATDARGFADHAIEHGDAMSVEVYGDHGADDTVEDAVSRVTEWVLSHLPESDPDAFLASLSLESQVSES